MDYQKLLKLMEMIPSFSGERADKLVEEIMIFDKLVIDINKNLDAPDRKIFKDQVNKVFTNEIRSKGIRIIMILNEDSLKKLKHEGKVTLSGNNTTVNAKETMTKKQKVKPKFCKYCKIIVHDNEQCRKIRSKKCAKCGNIGHREHCCRVKPKFNRNNYNNNNFINNKPEYSNPMRGNINPGMMRNPAIRPILNDNHKPSYNPGIRRNNGQMNLNNKSGKNMRYVRKIESN